MRWKETLYTRRLQRPLDDATRAAIVGVYERRRGEIPMPTEFQWHPQLPQFTIKAPLLALVVNFGREELQVVAELSLAAKAMATKRHRADAVGFIDSIVKDLGL